MLLNDTNDGTDCFNKALKNQGLTFQTRMTGKGDFLNSCNLYALITVNLRPSTKDLGYGKTNPRFALIGVQITRPSVEKLVNKSSQVGMIITWIQLRSLQSLKKIAGAGTKVMSTQQVDYNTIITRRNQLVSLLLSGRLV